MESVSTDVCIIGGGLAGLSCALALKDKGHSDFVVLEARSRFGGRTCSEITEHGCRVDAGGAYLGPGQDRVLQLCERFGIELYEVFCEGRSVFMHGTQHRDTYSGNQPPIGAVSLLDLAGLLTVMQEVADTIDVEEPWNSPRAKELDAMSVTQWVDAQGWTKQAKDAVLGAVQSLTCSNPCEISMLYWSWMIASCSNLLCLMAAKDGAQERKAVQGTQEISERIAKYVGNTRLRHAVREIDYRDKSIIRIRVEVFDAGGASHFVMYSARQVVIALAPSLYKSIVWNPALPPEKAQMGEHMPMGSIIKTNMYFDKPYWREKGLAGECFDSTGAPVVYAIDDCKPDGKYPSIMGFVSAHACRQLQLLTKEERKAILLKHYHRAYGFDAQPVAYFEKNWNAEPFSGGCYMGVCGPGVVTGFMHAIRKPIAENRIHFCGTETAVMWSGYMDGAVESGMRAAHEVLGLAFNARNRPPRSKLIDKDCINFTAMERRIPTLSTIVKTMFALTAAAAATFVYSKL